MEDSQYNYWTQQTTRKIQVKMLLVSTFTSDKDHLGAAEVKNHELHPKYGHAIPSQVHPT